MHLKKKKRLSKLDFSWILNREEKQPELENISRAFVLWTSFCVEFPFICCFWSYLKPEVDLLLAIKASVKCSTSPINQRFFFFKKKVNNTGILRPIWPVVAGLEATGLICQKTGVKGKGCPWAQVPNTVNTSFLPLGLRITDIAFVYRGERKSGEAYVQFAAPEMAARALLKHKEYMGSR